MKDPTSFYECHINKLKNEYQLQVCDFENEIKGADVPNADFITVTKHHHQTLIEALKQMHSDRNVKVVYITRHYSKMPFEIQKCYLDCDFDEFECEMSKVEVHKYIKSASVNKNVEILWDWIVNEEVPELKRR